MSGKVIKHIISGGQTGVDRAGLDVALELGIPCGGWCPNGRRAVDGRIPDKYPLVETPAHNYNTRTRLNVHDADGTLIINRGPLGEGTAYTVRLAQQQHKPHLVVDVEDSDAITQTCQWIEEHTISTLNVAGPREEKCPGIHEQACQFLKGVLR